MSVSLLTAESKAFVSRQSVEPSRPVPASVPSKLRKRHILPGFGLTMGFTVFYLTSLVLIPLVALFLKTVTPSTDFPTVGATLAHVWSVVSDARALESYRLSFGLSFVACLLNGFFGFVTAWVLVRYSFVGRKAVDALIDLPFAMPTAVAGIALTQICNDKENYLGGWIYRETGFQVAYSSVGILVALIFIGFPFVVRTLQPVLQDLSVEVEEAAACLGATRFQILRRVIFPAIRPALITGMMLAFGRAVGEYGSVTFISGNIPYQTEITPHLIIIKLDEYDYVGAAGLGAVMLIFSFLIVATTNGLQSLFARRKGLVK